MAIVTFQAKLRQGVRALCVDKNITANLTASISLGNYNRPIQPNNLFVITPNVLAQKLKRTAAVLLCPRPQPIITDQRYLTYGGGNNIITPAGVDNTNNWKVISSLTCEFPTYIEIDVEKLGLPEGIDVILNFDEGWVLEDRGRQLTSGAWEYPNAVQDSPSPLLENFVSFRTPKYGNFRLTPIFTQSLTALRIKQLAAAFPQALGSITFKIRYNPGRFASLFVEDFTLTSTPNFIHRPVLTLFAFTGGGSEIWNDFPYRLKYFTSTFDTSVFNQSADIKKFVGFSIPLNTVLSSSTTFKKYTGIVSNQNVQFTSNQTIRRIRNPDAITMAAEFTNFSIIGEIEQNTINMSSSFSQTATANFQVRSSKPALNVTSSQSTVIRKRINAVSTINSTVTCEAADDFVVLVTTTTPNYTWYLYTGGAYVIEPTYSYTNLTTTVPITESYSVNWGDGTTEYFSPDSDYTKTHTYARPGNYLVRIRGVKAVGSPRLGVTRWYAFGKDVVQVSNIWGTDNGDLTTNPEIPDYLPSQVRTFAFTFRRLTNFNRSVNNWDVSNITSFNGMFTLCSNYNQPMNNWDTGNAVSFGYMFEYCGKFNQDITMWDTSKVEIFTSMFRSPTSQPGEVPVFGGRFNQNLNNWDVSAGRDFDSMFMYQVTYNQPMNNWNVSNARNMYSMFYGSALNQNISSWNVSNVTNMAYMFGAIQAPAGTVNTISLNAWNVSNVTDMSYMFHNNSIYNGNISLWNTANVTDMSFMFYNASLFNQNIGNWDVSSVTNMEQMFYNARDFNQNIGNWDVSSVTNMIRMFYTNNPNYMTFNQDLSQWCVTNIPSQPSQFATNNNQWTQPKPVWGTCP